LYSIPTNKSIVVEQKGICCVEASEYLKMLQRLPKGSLIEITQKNKMGRRPNLGIIQSNGILTTKAIKNGKEISEATMIHFLQMDLRR